MSLGQLLQLIIFLIISYFIPPGIAAYGEDKSVVISKLYVPEVARAGEDVNLTCEFELRGHTHKLYTVNWWRGKDQFFSYKANNLYPKNAYNFQGITVDVEKSTQNWVVLEKITEQTSGEYKCEVMGESPAFKTAVGVKSMKVIVPPERIEINHGAGPGFNYQYQLGDNVELNCTVSGSKPRPVIIWKINEKLPNHHPFRFPDFENHRGRVTATSRLQFTAPQYFLQRRAEVACIAEVEGVKFVAEETLHLDPSAAFDQYSSCGWKRSMGFQIVCLLLLIGYAWTL